MKIIELHSSNIKKIKAVEMKLDKDKNLIIISGKNAAGKSSVLDSIWYALGGTKNIPENPIREGQEEAEIKVSLENSGKQYFVCRSFTKKGSYLKITTPEGNFSNPQEFLDFIIGSLSFDPLKFSLLDNKKQVQELIKIVGLDFTEVDNEKKKLSDDRILVGRQVKAVATYEPEAVEKAKIEATREEVSLTALSNQIGRETQIRSNFQNASARRNQIIAQEAELKKQLELLHLEFEELMKIEDSPADIEKMRSNLAGAEQINANIRNARQIVATAEEKDKRQKEYDGLTAKIEKIDEDKKEKLAATKMPITGLSWNEDGVLFNNIPFNQLSGAEQLKISMAIAMASNPKLKVILIRDGSLLDDDNLKIIEAMAKEKDYQIFLEKVSSDEGVGIVIEDGEVKKNNL